MTIILTTYWMSRETVLLTMAVLDCKIALGPKHGCSSLRRSIFCTGFDNAFSCTPNLRENFGHQERSLKKSPSVSPLAVIWLALGR